MTSRGRARARPTDHDVFGTVVYFHELSPGTSVQTMMNFIPLSYDAPLANETEVRPVETESRHGYELPAPVTDPEFLRQCAWEIGAKRASEAYMPTDNHVGLGMVAPQQGFCHWRIRHDWIEDTRQRRGNAWHQCRMILRLYDVSFIQFNGMNAHSMQDHTLPAITGQMFFKLPRPGTWQIAEVGFLLRSGEFIPAARSQSVAFAPDCANRRCDHAGLLVTPNFRVQEVANIWDQERILRELRQPQVRTPLRLAFFGHSASRDDISGRFVRELAAAQQRLGHDVHVFLPAAAGFDTPRQEGGIHYHPLHFHANGDPLGWASAYACAAEERLRELPPFDLHHVQEWLTGLAADLGKRPCVLALSSVEATRRNGSTVSVVSREIEAVERTLARSAKCVLAADWLREQAVAALGLDTDRVHAFSMEGQLPDAWAAPLDFGTVKMGIGVGPLDRMLLFVGPLEHAAGVDLLVDALPVLLHRASNVRVVLVGTGPMWGHLEHRARQVGAGHALRLLGHVDGAHLTRLLRSAEALVLPSRYRVPMDDAVVDLARCAGRPVVTTHSGPVHLVRHEENGIVTFDNPGSMVWAMDRILGDPHHAERLGRNGRRADTGGADWDALARRYVELCANTFPQLTAMPKD
jgi:glycogen(starch) synthase